jgi:hypothetical protein
MQHDKVGKEQLIKKTHLKHAIVGALNNVKNCKMTTSSTTLANKP